MRVLLSFFFILFFTIVNAQEEIRQPFDSPIIAYNGIGFYIPKARNQVIVKSQELRIEEDSTHFIIRWGKIDENFLILGEVQDGDTINKQRFEFQFIPVGKPVLKWKCQEKPESHNRITLHKDSLEQLQEFYLESWRKTTPPAVWKVHKGQIQYTGLKSRPLKIDSNFLTNEVIDSLSTLGDTFQLSLVLTVSMQDGIRRKLVDSAEIILLGGKAYERHIDPQYNFKHYKDTLYITKDQLEGNDTLVLQNRGHLFIGLPRMKYDYEVFLDDGNCYYGVKDVYTKVPKGKGYFIYDAWGSTGIHTLVMRFDKGEKSKKIRIKKIEVP